MYLKIATLISLFVFLVSCEEGNYGDKLSDFVDDDVPKLSLRMAKAGIKEKIHNAYILEYSSLMLKANNIHKKLENSKVKPISFSNLTMRDAQSKRNKLLQKEEEALGILRDIDQIEKEITKLDNVCTNMDKSFLKELVTAEVFQVTVPETEDRYYLGTEFITVIVENITSLFSSINQDKQNGIMEEALSRVEKKLPSKTELASIFSLICNNTTEDFNSSEASISFHDVYSNIKTTANTYYEYIFDQISFAGKRIHQLAYQSLVKEYGLDGIKELQLKSKFEEGLFRTYQKLLRKDYELVKGILNTRSKLEYFKGQRKWEKLYKEKLNFLYKTKNKWSHYNNLMKQHEAREIKVRNIFKLIEKRRYL